MRVGFIGLGRMGAPMAARIAAVGHTVTGYDISLERRQQGVAGVSLVNDIAVVGSAADVVITSLPGPAQVDEVLRGSRKFLSALKPGSVIVETSTISPQQSRSLAADFAKQRVSYLDAPISGGTQGAREGTLVVMVGGEIETLERVRPILACFAKVIFHLGSCGMGNAMKLVIQSIFLAQMAAFLEAVSMGERSGIALGDVLQIVAASSAHHPTIGTRYEKLRAGNLDPIFEVEAAVKDMSLAEQLWRDSGCSFPTLLAALSDYRNAATHGLSRADLIAVRNFLNRKVDDRAG
jgi:3-hydroxyisobutyrate dehydrogenase-like beta-hydroxyacid dehydrogenase